MRNVKIDSTTDSELDQRIAGTQPYNTVSLTVDFIGPGKVGDLVVAQVRVTRRTRTLVFQSASIAIAERVIMVASGLWKIG